MKAIITVVCLTAIIVGSAAADQSLPPKGRDMMTDWQCMTDCQRRGYMYQYCLKVCSY